MPLPGGGALNAKVQPGMAFSIVSAAALLPAGVAENQPLPCRATATVGGETFSYQASDADQGDLRLRLRRRLRDRVRDHVPDPDRVQLTAVERAFGIGSSWHLRVPAFSGSASAASGRGGAGRAGDRPGGVLMSPLGMAMVAAEVDSGVGRLARHLARDPAATWQAPLSGTSLASSAADAAGGPVRVRRTRPTCPASRFHGQAGVVKTGAHAYLSWFVGYRGGLAVAAIETGTTPARRPRRWPATSWKVG